MSGKTIRVCTVSVLLMAGGMHVSAEAAAPTENITVTATKSREVLGKFTKSFAAPSRLTGKIARWERRVCPVAVGQQPSFTRFITQRVKYVALAAGAPVNTEASCTPNIEIVFTTAPQELMDSVRKNQPVYLGYADTSAQREKLATVIRPVQAWYTTETVDFSGRRHLDSGLPPGVGVTMPFSGLPMPDSVAAANDSISVPYYARSSGDRIDDGIHSGFNHILIVIDTKKVAGRNFVSLADYISLLALTQLDSLDACQTLPSIVNILAEDCGHPADDITQFDLAYLHGLYRMSPGRSVVLQRNEIADVMTDTLAKAK
ncbi:MAG: hypothetical protein ABI608_06910 [Rhizomicrobium sp.]